MGRAQSAHLDGMSGAVATHCRAVTYWAPAVLLMGSERVGLGAAHQAARDAVVRILMVGSADSLNPAVATGLVLFAIFKQQ